MSTITITDEHIKFLQDNRIFLNSTGTYKATWLKVGSSYNTVGKTVIEPYSGIFVGSRLSSIGAFSYSKSYFPPQYFIVGRYCAIAQLAQVIPVNHPVDRLCMGGFDYSRAAPFGIFEADCGISARKVIPKVPNEMTVVGHDVWIGQDAMIKRGVKIGTGAVIGARSIVTKDIPPYAVVVGSSIIKKYRFNEILIERLLASEWWKYSYDQFAGMDTTAPLEFLPAFEDAKAAGRLTVFEENHIDVHTAFREISKRSKIAV